MLANGCSLFHYLLQETSKAITDFSQAINSKWSDVRKEVQVRASVACTCSLPEPQLQKKKLHVRSVIAKVTGQSDQAVVSEEGPPPVANADLSSQMQSARNSVFLAQDRARSRTTASAALPNSAVAGEEDCPHPGPVAEIETHSDSDSDAQSSSGSVTKWKSQQICRIDFELDSTVLEGFSETIGIIRSHFCYWDHKSVAALIVAIMHAPPPLSSEVEFGCVDVGCAE